MQLIGLFIASLFVFQVYGATYLFRVSTQNTGGQVRFLFTNTDGTTVANPDINAKTGDTLIFIVSGLTVAPAQTFFIATTQNQDGTTQYTGQSPSPGLTTADGNLTLTIGALLDTPTTLYYLSKASNVAAGRILVTRGSDCSVNGNPNGGSSFDASGTGATSGDCFQGGNGTLQNGNICYPTCAVGSPTNLTGICGNGIIRLTGSCNGFTANPTVISPSPVSNSTSPSPSPSPSSSPSPSPTVIITNPTPNNDNNNDVTYIFQFTGTSTHNCAYMSNTVIPALQSFGNSRYADSSVTFTADLHSCSDNSDGSSNFVIYVTVYGEDADNVAGDVEAFENVIISFLTSNNNAYGINILSAGYKRNSGSSPASGFFLQASVALMAAVVLAIMA